MSDFIWPSDLDRAESDELARVCEYLEEVCDERDALAAHVEDGKLLVRDLLVDDVTDDATHLTEWAEIESPSASLDRLKAEWQVEVLEAFCKRNRLGVDALHDYLKTSKLLREKEGE